MITCGHAIRALKMAGISGLLLTASLAGQTPGVEIGGQTPRPSLGESYALVVGISDYQHLPSPDGERAEVGRLRDLRFAQRDADSIYRILISNRGGAFKVENVRLLLGSDATQSNLRDSLQNWLPQKSEGAERVLIYFSGHGLVSGGQTYLLPWDGDPRNLRRSGYSTQELGEIFRDDIHAKHKVLITDACHSGRANEALAENNAKSSVQINRDLQNVAGTHFSLAASRGDEESRESEEIGGGHGVFTYYLKQALEGQADRNKDGFVSAGEVALYVRKLVSEWTVDAQHPTWNQTTFDPDLPLAYLPDRWAERGDIGTWLVKSNRDGVHLFIDDSERGQLNRGETRSFDLVAGWHSVTGRHPGYQPDGPRPVLVYPNRTYRVNLSLNYTGGPSGSRMTSVPKVAESDLEPETAGVQLSDPTDQQTALRFESDVDDVRVFLDGDFKGVVRRNEPILEAGLLPGDYTVMGSKTGYRSDGPRTIHLYRRPLNRVVLEMEKGADPDPQVVKKLRRCSKTYGKGGKPNYEDAVRCFQEAATRSPGNREAALYSARAYRRLFQFELAERWARKAIELDPAYDEAYKSLAGILLDRSRVDEAARILTAVRVRTPNDDQTLSALAQVYRIKGSYLESMRMAARAIQQNPENAQAHIFLAEALRLHWNTSGVDDNLRDAIKEYRRFLELTDFESGTSEKVLNYWFRGFLIGGGVKRTSSQADVWRRQRGRAYFGLGDAYRALKDYHASREHFDRALQNSPEDHYLHLALGRTLISLFLERNHDHDLRKAREHFIKVADIAPESDEAREAQEFLVEIRREGLD